MLLSSITRSVCIKSKRLCFLTMALHRVGLVLRSGLHHLLHHITLPMGCCQGHHDQEDACYTYVHLLRSNLEHEQGDSQHKVWSVKQASAFSPFLSYFLEFNKLSLCMQKIFTETRKTSNMLTWSKRSKILDFLRASWFLKDSLSTIPDAPSIYFPSQD